MTTADLTRRNARPHAWLFAITATIGLLPGTYGLVMSMFTIVLIPPVLLMWTIGFALLGGYWWYVLGEDEVTEAGPLWTATAVYNGLMSVGWLAFASDGIVRALERGVWGDAAGFLAAGLWLAFLTGVAVHARVLDAPPLVEAGVAEARPHEAAR